MIELIVTCYLLAGEKFVPQDGWAITEIRHVAARYWMEYTEEPHVEIVMSDKNVPPDASVRLPDNCSGKVHVRKPKRKTGPE